MVLEVTHSNRFLQSILDCIGVGVVVTDRDGCIQLYNPEAEAILGPNLANTRVDEWSANHGIFKSEIEATLTDEENPLFAAMRGETILKGQVFVRNESSPLGVWCNINVRPLMNDRNVQIGGIISIENITQQKRLSAELERSNRDLQEFAYVAAHDLQEPLRTIVGFGDLLQSNTREAINEKSADQLNRILAAARRMQVLIAAVLKFARVETKAKPPVVCEAKSIVSDALGDLYSTIQENEAVFKIDVEHKILVDQSQATQLFQNLVANAIKYRSEKRPEIEISSKRLGIYVQFKIQDNGIGFEPRYAEKIFVLFKRLHTRDTYDGAGVGLSICKKIVERHGGTISAESSPGQGTCITFTLPKAI
jgi:light-regulated signal transduction histidine kinase (bacteriophytochrome)